MESKVDRQFASKSEDLWVALSGFWLLLGLAIDGYAHANIIDGETESFFTVWHAVFYAGFFAAVIVLGSVLYKRRAPGSIWDWAPAGYRSSLIGVGVFAVGGIGDSIWHTIFGVEKGIDALLSPTHLLLFVGIFLIVTTPVRSSLEQTVQVKSGATGKANFATVLSLGLVTSLIAFFTSFIWVPIQPYLLQEVYFVPEDFADEFIGEAEVGVAIAGSMFVTLVLLVPFLLARRFWRLPFGSAAACWGVATLVAGLVFAGQDSSVYDYLMPVVVVAFAGLGFDALNQTKIKANKQELAMAVGCPLVLWTVWVVAEYFNDGIVWMAELWTGLIVANVLLGSAVYVLMNNSYFRKIGSNNGNNG